MKIFRTLYIIIWAFFCFVVVGQEAASSYYLPYQMPAHAFVKYNAFLRNPSFTHHNEQGQQVGAYYRSQWMGYNNESFALMGLGYTNKWRVGSAMSAFVYKRNAGVMSNMGIVLNYAHYLPFSHDSGLRLGLNVIPTFSSLDRSRVVIPDATDPLLNTGSTFGFTAQPGFDVNFGGFYIGAAADNLVSNINGASSQRYVFHLMYKYEIDQGGRGTDRKLTLGVFPSLNGSKINGSAQVLFDSTKFWAYAAAEYRYGILAGAGLYLMENIGIGMEYEMPILRAIPGVGSTVGAYVSMKFGAGSGTLSASRAKKYRRGTRATQETLSTRTSSNQVTQANKPKPAPPKPAATTPPPPPPEPPKPSDGFAVRTESVADDKVAGGYYLIIGSFNEPKYAQSLIASKRTKYEVGGFSANGRNYVYLERKVSTEAEARKLYDRYVKNTKDFPSGMWVLQVTK